MSKDSLRQRQGQAMLAALAVISGLLALDWLIGWLLQTFAQGVTSDSDAYALVSFAKSASRVLFYVTIGAIAFALLFLGFFVEMIHEMRRKDN